MASLHPDKLVSLQKLAQTARAGARPKPAASGKPALTGRELAVTRGRGKKKGLRRQLGLPEVAKPANLGSSTMRPQGGSSLLEGLAAKVFDRRYSEHYARLTANSPYRKDR